MAELEDDVIDLRIPTVKDKLLASFPNDLRSDIKIVFKSKTFLLAKAHLRLESGYFKDKLSPPMNFLEIKENFNQQVFEKVMSCFYGATVQMPRNQLANYYAVIKFLEIQYLLNFIKNDILKNISEYDLFVVMKIANAYLQQKIFQVCIEELQKQSFQQLKYHQFQFLQLELPLFKLIIQTHQRHRKDKKPGIPYLQINQFIRDYCDGKGMTQQEYIALKMQLIDQNALTANEYKQIFLNEVKKIQTKPIGMSIVGDYPTNQSIIVNGNNFNTNKLEATKLAESMIGTGNGMVRNLVDQSVVTQSPINMANMSVGSNMPNSTTKYGNFETLQMQNFFHKKQNQQLRIQNQELADSLKNLRQMTQQNQKIHLKMENQLNILKQQLKKKQMLQIQHKRKISKLENGMTLMQRQLQKKAQNINQLAQMIEELKKRRPQSYEEQQQENNMIVQSQFLPAHLIQQMMVSDTPTQAKSAQNKNQEKSHQINYEALDEEELEQLYLPRIKFDVQPISTPKFNLPKLCLFITNDGFNKYALNLIYRRSVSAPPKGINSDILHRKNLLILIATASGQNIGGFISVPIQKKEDYTEDEGAFLFSLTKNQKFKIKKNDATQAIFMSEQQYLVSFANDLAIASDCLKTKSQCSWPSSFEGVKGLKQKGSVWFAGDSLFMIKHIEIYEMGEEEMQMVL